MHHFQECTATFPPAGHTDVKLVLTHKLGWAGVRELVDHPRKHRQREQLRAPTTLPEASSPFKSLEQCQPLKPAGS